MSRVGVSYSRHSPDLYSCALSQQSEEKTGILSSAAAHSAPSRPTGCRKWLRRYRKSPHTATGLVFLVLLLEATMLTALGECWNGAAGVFPMWSAPVGLEVMASVPVGSTVHGL